ncbi:hypothetical protein [Hyalangium rubrum]|uniref:Uncharacterized protein n=1 Tax=Hyalangium rubrum TaxID=3103134 RepID=A0ABU5GXU4_9BACT|nr:hypothetical protein [Hyalangium sp. s54d21]MDY7226010.1 hypothetical protein [Hyalangium sp. s54d21]
MAMLPALMTSLVLATTPAMRYSSAVRTETFVRTPNLTERADSDVLQDFVITPRGEVILYAPRMEVKAILEPQLMMRRAFTQPTLEVLTFLFLRGEYQLTRGFKVWAMESMTYGSFPFEDFRVPAPTIEGDVRLLDASQYVYSESMVGFDVTSIRRTYIGVMGGLVVNGLLDAPENVRPRGDRVTPSQIGPEVRALVFHSATRRLVLGMHVYAREVNFSTDARLSLLQAMPVLQYKFHPLIEGRLEAGVAVGERRPQDTPYRHSTESILHPTGEASLSVPVPVGFHWPVKAKLTARYVPFVNAFTTDVFPRTEGAFGFEWKGRRKAQVNVELSAAQARTDGFHRRDGEERLSFKVQWPVTRSSAVVASGRLLRLREFLIDDDPIYKWFAGVGLVIRQENGRL